MTVDHGLHIVRDGSRNGCDEAGTGRLGSFAAYAGNCDVERELEWLPLSSDDAPIEWSRETEATMRARAFSLAMAATTAA